MQADISVPGTALFFLYFHTLLALFQRCFCQPCSMDEIYCLCTDVLLPWNICNILSDEVMHRVMLKPFLTVDLQSVAGAAISCNYSTQVSISSGVRRCARVRPWPNWCQGLIWLHSTLYSEVHNLESISGLLPWCFFSCSHKEWNLPEYTVFVCVC